MEAKRRLVRQGLVAAFLADAPLAVLTVAEWGQPADFLLCLGAMVISLLFLSLIFTVFQGLGEKGRSHAPHHAIALPLGFAAVALALLLLEPAGLWALSRPGATDRGREPASAFTFQEAQGEFLKLQRGPDDGDRIGKLADDHRLPDDFLLWVAGRNPRMDLGMLTRRRLPVPVLVKLAREGEPEARKKARMLLEGGEAAGPPARRNPAAE